MGPGCPSGKASENAVDHYSHIVAGNGGLRVGGPEPERASAHNVYEIEWVAPEALEDVGLVPPEAFSAVRAALERSELAPPRRP